MRSSFIHYRLLIIGLITLLFGLAAGCTERVEEPQPKGTNANHQEEQGTQFATEPQEIAKQASVNQASPASANSTSTNTPSKDHQSEGHLSKDKADYQTLEWIDLLPDEDLEALKNPPEILDEIVDGSEADQISSQLRANPMEPDDNANPEDNAYEQALRSTKIRPEFNNRRVRIPGFIVPLEFDDQQVVSTFFLVPFFGACLHMPPPPPNQIIYARYPPGQKLSALYDAFWIQGTLLTQQVENDLALAAYSLEVDRIESYYPTDN